MSAAEQVAAALGMKRTKPGHWRRACPAHDTAHDDSLSVWDTGNGKAGLHDFGGCDAEAVLATAGLPLAALYDTYWEKRSRGSASATAVVGGRIPGAGNRLAVRTIRYPLPDASGRVVAVHARKEFADGGKKVWWERPDGTLGLGGTKIEDLPLYGVHELNGAGEVVVTEGEKARDALAGLGVPAVGTVTGAEATPADDPLRPLLAVPTVYLWPDNDDVGRSHMDGVAGRLVGLGHPDVRIVDWTGVPPKDDAADLVAAGGALDDVRRLLAEARGYEARGGDVEAAEGREVLDEVHAFLGRFVAYPSEHARVAHTLWVLHAHLMDAWESTPRLAALSPEPASGKTRLLEITELLVPNPVEAVSVSAAYLFRKVGDEGERPTLLYDEIDTVFGPKAKENEEIRGLLNAGHRKGAIAGRCVVRGKEVVTVDYPAYCAVALAGLGDLPDTILSRSVIIRMRRRAPGERVEPYRRRLHAPEGHELRKRLAAWAKAIRDKLTWPELPPGIEDRDADVWEPLLAVADAAGGEWPGRARVAAVALVADSKESTPSLGIRLLADLRTVFGDADAMSTEATLSALRALEEAPWGELVGGKPLNARGLAQRLRQYGVKSKTVRVGTATPKGYARADLTDAWGRYLPPPPQESATSATSATDATQGGLSLGEDPASDDEGDPFLDDGDDWGAEA